MSLSPAPEQALLYAERDRAERRLNAARALILVCLAAAAAAYAPTLSRPLNITNIVVLTPMLVWTFGQYLVLYRRERLPGWLFLANPVVDITGVTCIMGGYGLAASGALALKSPMVLAYFAILSARPIASSTRNALITAILAVAEYAGLVAFFIFGSRVTVVDPVSASTSGSIALLDEGVKLLLLATAGGIATYATAWHEQLAMRYSTEAREREELRSRLVASQLETLKLQLHPHFLFNTLNTISALIHTDPRGAERMIAGLSELIRVALYSVVEQEVPLHRELELLGHYIDIQQIRFEDRLRIVTHVDEGVDDALVPQLILQPLVENAIKHGIAPRAMPGRIEIRAHRRNGDLYLSVSDDGVGVDGGAPDDIAERVGIGNARSRLRYLYGEQHSLTLDAPREGGFAVHITLPYRSAGAGSVPGVLGMVEEMV